MECGRPGFDPWVGKIPWRKERLPTPVFWSGEFHGLYSSRGCKESDTTERLSFHSFCCLVPFCPTACGPGPSLGPQLPLRDAAGPPRRTLGGTIACSPSGTFPLLAVPGRPWLPAATTLCPKPGSAGTQRLPLSPAQALRRWPKKNPDTRGASRTQPYFLTLLSRLKAA